ncbi:MAG: hypothetical protein N3D10_02310 [Candidatus Micrarchaeota archaeon]|nr:hypothetical protein [Candidatus Micrarchaeota archaeon]
MAGNKDQNNQISGFQQKVIERAQAKQIINKQEAEQINRYVQAIQHNISGVSLQLQNPALLNFQKISNPCEGCAGGRGCCGSFNKQEILAYINATNENPKIFFSENPKDLELRQKLLEKQREIIRKQQEQQTKIFESQIIEQFLEIQKEKKNKDQNLKPGSYKQDVQENKEEYPPSFSYSKEQIIENSSKREEYLINNEAKRGLSFEQKNTLDTLEKIEKPILKAIEIDHQQPFEQNYKTNSQKREVKIQTPKAKEIILIKSHYKGGYGKKAPVTVNEEYKKENITNKKQKIVSLSNLEKIKRTAIEAKNQKKIADLKNPQNIEQKKKAELNKNLKLELKESLKKLKEELEKQKKKQKNTSEEKNAKNTKKEITAKKENKKEKMLKTTKLDLEKKVKKQKLQQELKKVLENIKQKKLTERAIVKLLLLKGLYKTANNKRKVRKILNQLIRRLQIKAAA